MITVREIAMVMEEYAPKSLAEKWDNVGLNTGSFDAKVSTVLIALDADDSSVSEAIGVGAELIITHHPLIFSPLLSVTNETMTGVILQRLIANGISLFTAHTNLDAAKGGVNDVLAQKLKLSDVKEIYAHDFEGSARMGYIKEQTLGKFAEFVKETLCSTVIKCVGDKNKKIRTVGVCGGSCGHMIEGAKQNGCDLLVGGEAKYNDEKKAAHLELCLLEAGHFETERVVCNAIRDRLLDVFNDLKVIVSKRTTTYYE